MPMKIVRDFELVSLFGDPYELLSDSCSEAKRSSLVGLAARTFRSANMLFYLDSMLD